MKSLRMLALIGSCFLFYFKRSVWANQDPIFFRSINQNVAEQFSKQLNNTENLNIPKLKKVNLAKKLSTFHESIIPDPKVFPELKRKEIKDKFLNKDELTIEIQVYLDSLVYESIQVGIATKKLVDVEEYLLTFFKGVNHIYANSHGNSIFFPSITVRVCKVSILPEKIEQQIFKGASDDPSVHIVQHVLKYFRQYGKKFATKFDAYDHSMLLTGRDLYRKVGDNYDAGVLGVAFLNGTCTKSTSARFESFSVVEDPGALFLGVYPAVHELAHNLGVKHDSKSDAACNSKHGFIMSPATSGTSNMYHFSSCSMEYISNFLDSERSDCLAQTTLPSISSASQESIRFPGDVYTMQEICDSLAAANFPNEIDLTAAVNTHKSPDDLCKQVSCKVKIGGRKFPLELPLPPGENVTCGFNGFCKLGECNNF